VVGAAVVSEPDVVVDCPVVVVDFDGPAVVVVSPVDDPQAATRTRPRISPIALRGRFNTIFALPSKWYWNIL